MEAGLGSNSSVCEKRHDLWKNKGVLALRRVDSRPGEPCPQGLHNRSPFVKDTGLIVPAVPFFDGRLQRLDPCPLDVRAPELDEAK